MLLSIVLPIHNEPELVKRCLDAIVPELTSEIELIVVDDQSDQDTKQLLQQYGSAIIVVETKQREGVPGPCRNLGASVATGDYIWCIDYDDMVLKGALAIAKDLIIENSDYDIIYLGQLSSTRTLYGKVVDAPQIQKFGADWTIPDTIEQRFMQGFFVPGSEIRWYGCTWMYFYKRSIFEHQQFHRYAAEDLEFFAKALGAGYSIVNVQSCLYRKIFRDNSLFHSLTLDQAFAGVCTLLDTVCNIVSEFGLDEYTRQKLIYVVVAGPILDYINLPTVADPQVLLDYIDQNVDKITVTPIVKKSLISFFIGQVIRSELLKLK